MDTEGKIPRFRSFFLLESYIREFLFQGLGFALFQSKQSNAASKLDYIPNAS